MLPSSCARSLCLAPFQVPMRSTSGTGMPASAYSAQLALHGKAGCSVGAGHQRDTGGAGGARSIITFQDAA